MKFILLFLLSLALSVYGQESPEYFFDDAETILVKRMDGVCASGLITNSQDTFRFKNVKTYHVFKKGGKYGIWPSESEQVFKDFFVATSQAISVEKKKNGNFIVTFSPEAMKIRKKRGGVLEDSVWGRLTTVEFNFPDGSFIKFTGNGNDECVFISSGKGLAMDLAKYFY